MEMGKKVLETGEKVIHVIKWQRNWMNCAQAQWTYRKQNLRAIN
jgi:predicted  nucleic acid-binding Zn ribbon protein